MLRKDLLLALGLCFFIFLSLSLGEIRLSFRELIEVLSLSPKGTASTLVFDLRLPRLLSVLITGASLAGCGLYFQSLLKNPLAEPFTLGFSGAAALGVSIAIVLGFNDTFWGPSFFGLSACLGVVALSLYLQNSLKLRSGVGVILVGLSIGFFCSAIVVITQSLLMPNELFNSFQWLIGSFDSFRTQHWPILLVPLICLVLFQLRFGKQLDLVLLGDKTASSLGVSVHRLRSIALVLGALVCGFSVYVSGVIAFIGLVAPHITKKLYKTNLHRALFPRVLLVGAFCLLVADVIAIQLSFEQSLPTGGVVSLLGAPFLVFLLAEERSL